MPVKKRWRWVGVFSPELMLCVGDARVGPVPRRWWAVCLPDGTLVDGSRGVRMSPGRAVVDGVIDVAFEESEGFELSSTTARGNWIWTRKQGDVPARGRVELPGGRAYELDARAIVDDSSGRHDRHTSWRWCAGVGVADDGTPVAWNLVDGIHDAPGASERRVWRDGHAVEVGPVEFAADLSGVGGLAFSPWAERREDVNLLIARSRYRQPFGSFSGELPDGTSLSAGYGVMEEHDALW